LFCRSFVRSCRQFLVSFGVKMNVVQPCNLVYFSVYFLEFILCFVVFSFPVFRFFQNGLG